MKDQRTGWAGKTEFERAAGVLRDGGVIAYAAETIYGLGCRANDPGGIERIRRIKGRDAASPFLALLADAGDLESVVGNLDDDAARFLHAVWPGPVTAILPGTRPEYAALASPAGTIGLRLPDDPDLRRVIRDSGAPLVSTSANRSGRPAAASAREIESLFDLGTELDLIWDRGDRQGGIPSAVVDLSGKEEHGIAFRVVRPGPPDLVLCDPVTLRRLAGEKDVKRILVVCSGNTCRSALAQALLSAEAKKKGLPLFVASAGTGALMGQRASEGAQRAAKEMGLDLSLHRSQPVTPILLEKSDLILVMEEHHRSYLREHFSSEGNPQRIYLFSEFAGEGDSGIPDPWGGSEETFRAVRDRIAVLAEKIIMELQRGNDCGE